MILERVVCSCIPRLFVLESWVYNVGPLRLHLGVEDPEPR